MRIIQASKAKKLSLKHRDKQYIPNVLNSIAKKIERAAVTGRREIVYIRATHKYMQTIIVRDLKIVVKMLIKNGYRVKYKHITRDDPKFNPYMRMEIFW